jgi:capsular polysaccharide biosynthesis protein
MDLAVYNRAIRVYWPIAVALALVGGGALGFVAKHQEPVYQAETHLRVSFLRARQAAADPLVQRRVKTYASMLNTQRLTEPVIRSLRLPYSPAELGGRIVASSPLNTLAIDLAVADVSAVRAADIANGLVAELTKVAEREKPTTELPAQTRIQVVSAAAVPQRPLPVRWKLHIVAGALAGLAVGLGLAVPLQYRRDDTRSDPQP